MTSFPEVDVAILVGGKGSRLKSVVDDRPKPMANVKERPFLEWLLRYLRSLSFNKIVLCTGYRAEYIENYFGNGEDFGLVIEYSRETEPLGTAGAIRNALQLVSSERFFVLNGDSFCAFDPEGMMKNHLEAEAKATIWLIEVPDCGHFGSVSLDSEGNITSFKEKCPGKVPGLINAGIYLLERSLLEQLPPGKNISIENDVFPGLKYGGYAWCDWPRALPGHWNPGNVCPGGADIGE